MKEEILLINGKKYVYTPEPEVKEEKRLEGWINGGLFAKNKCSHMSRRKMELDTVRMVELKENEIILSEDEVRNAWHRVGFGIPYREEFINDLFKKDGV